MEKRQMKPSVGELKKIIGEQHMEIMRLNGMLKLAIKALEDGQQGLFRQTEVIREVANELH